MDDTSWTDRIVGERMTVDQEFSSRVTSSTFSNQEWSLIMTATRFEIEDPDDPETARLVANTEQVEQVLPELETIRAQPGGMGPGGQDSGGLGLGLGGGGGFLESIRDKLGVGGSDDSYDEERDAAERLTAEYAELLQAKLEENGRWDDIRRAAAENADRADEADSSAD